MTSLISRIDHLNKKKEEKLIKDMITKFGENKFSDIKSLIQTEQNLVHSDISYHHLCDKIAYHITNPSVKIPSHATQNITDTAVKKDPTLIQHKQQQISPLPKEELPQRQMPFNPKNKMYDEWGAIILQQDEYVKQMKINEIIQKKSIQENYKKQLQKQIDEKREINLINCKKKNSNGQHESKAIHQIIEVRF